MAPWWHASSSRNQTHRRYGISKRQRFEGQQQFIVEAVRSPDPNQVSTATADPAAGHSSLQEKGQGWTPRWSRLRGHREKLAGALRGLIGKSWSFYRLRSEDVEAAAKQGMLWEIGGSWAISQESDGMFEVLMVDASPSDADDFVRALVDVAVDREAENFRIWVADQSWLVTALTTAGCQIDPSRIYELAL